MRAHDIVGKCTMAMLALHNSLRALFLMAGVVATLDELRAALIKAGDGLESTVCVEVPLTSVELTSPAAPHRFAHFPSV
jgi:hypothetical protein